MSIPRFIIVLFAVDLALGLVYLAYFLIGHPYRAPRQADRSGRRGEPADVVFVDPVVLRGVPGLGLRHAAR